MLRRKSQKKAGFMKFLKYESTGIEEGQNKHQGINSLKRDLVYF